MYKTISTRDLPYVYPHPWGALNDIAALVGKNAIDKGFRNAEPNRDMLGTRLLLVVSEVCEALESVRKGDMVQDVHVTKQGKLEGFPTELADVIIRVLDLCDEYGIDVGRVCSAKHEYNLTREARHGKLF